MPRLISFFVLFSLALTLTGCGESSGLTSSNAAALLSEPEQLMISANRTRTGTRARTTITAAASKQSNATQDCHKLISNAMSKVKPFSPSAYNQVHKNLSETLCPGSASTSADARLSTKPIDFCQLKNSINKPQADPQCEIGSTGVPSGFCIDTMRIWCKLYQQNCKDHSAMPANCCKKPYGSPSRNYCP
jgi:hypothetical protein